MSRELERSDRRRAGAAPPGPAPLGPGPEDPCPHVVIVGGGFGGLEAAKAFAKAEVRVTLVDRSNHHLFQPLLYQVAMAGLSPAEIAIPIRTVLRRHQNVTVFLGEVTRIDTAAQRVHLAEDLCLTYDFLIVAAGARVNYFGNDRWARYASGLKTVEDGVEIRRRVLLAFERAEREPDVERRQRLLTFVVIGGGPTGVELAGALSELARRALAKDFRRIHPDMTRVILLEAAPRVLMPFDPELSAEAQRQLERLHVEVRTGKQVVDIDARGVHLEDELIETEVVLWAAGVAANPLAESLGVPLDRQGRVIVAPDCSIPGHPEVFVVGDLAHFEDPGGQVLPGISPVAMQQARSVARNILRALDGQPRVPFRYRDKGMMATVGRSMAVAQIGRVRFSGGLAWLAWLFVHLWYLVGFKNRVFVLLQWIFAYLMYRRGARLITAPRALPPGPPPEPEEARVERGPAHATS